MKERRCEIQDKKCEIRDIRYKIRDTNRGKREIKKIQDVRLKMQNGTQEANYLTHNYDMVAASKVGVRLHVF